MDSSQNTDGIRTRRCINSVFLCLAGRWELPFLKQLLLFPGFLALWPTSPSIAMSCRALPSIPCVHVEIAASRPPMVRAWGELSWHKEGRSASLAFGARCLLISDCWSNASSGVGVEKGIWAVKCGKGKRGQGWQLLCASEDLLTAEALRDYLAARPMGSPMICPQTSSWQLSFLNSCLKYMRVWPHKCLAWTEPKTCHGNHAHPGKSGQQHNWSKADMDHRVRITISPTLPPSCN